MSSYLLFFCIGHFCRTCISAADANIVSANAARAPLHTCFKYTSRAVWLLRAKAPSRRRVSQELTLTRRRLRQLDGGGDPAAVRRGH